MLGFAIAIYLIGSAADVWTTWRAIHDHVGLAEKNPLMAKVLARFGWKGLAEAKIAILAVILIATSSASLEGWRLPFLIMSGLLYVYVALRNYRLAQAAPAKA